GPADPRAHLEAGRAEPGPDRDLVLHPERPGLDPCDLRSDRQHVTVTRRAQELRSRLDDRHTDDVVLRKCLRPRKPEGSEQRLATKVVPLEEARIEDDPGRSDVAPAYLHVGRVLDHRRGSYRALAVPSRGPATVSAAGQRLLDLVQGH